MPTPEEIHKLDQDLATMAEFYPRIWRNLYESCIKEGFNESDAMRLVRSYIEASCRFIGG